MQKYIKETLQNYLCNKDIILTLILKKNGGHLGRHLGFLKTPQVYAKVPGSLINFRLCRTFWYMTRFVRFHGRVPCSGGRDCHPTSSSTHFNWLCNVFSVSQNKDFEVPAGSLGFSVVVYTVLAIFALALLLVRRYVPLFGSAELGGPQVPKMVTGVIFIVMWVIYVLLSSLQAYGAIDAGF